MKKKSKKIYRLTKKQKEEVDKNWHRNKYSNFGGKALDYVKNLRAASLKRIKKAKELAEKERKKEERSIAYYRKNPIIINGKPIPVDSLSFESLRQEAKAQGIALRTLARISEKDGGIDMLANIYAREQSLMKQIKGDNIYINGRKSSRAALKKRLREIRNIAANYSTGFDMHISADYDKRGNVYFTLPTYPQLSDIQDVEDFFDFFDNFDDISITASL